MTQTTLNDGNVTITDTSITYKRLFNTKVIQRNKIVETNILYDNWIYKIMGIPIGIFYCITIGGIPLGIHCIKRDVLINIRTREDVYSFWLKRDDLDTFKSIM
jgi:uncharacterized membrane protein YccF (DUF307 family)